jgi:hypothetical protein
MTGGIAGRFTILSESELKYLLAQIGDAVDIFNCRDSDEVI